MKRSFTTAFVLVLLALAPAGWAEPTADPPDPPGDQKGGDEAAEAPAPPEWCAERGPMNVVAGYDAGKHFRYVESMAVDATERFAATLCPGDSVRLVSFGVEIEWLGPPIEIASLEDRAKVVERFEKRARPSAMSSVNDTLVKTALKYWEEGGLREDDLPALYVFTDTIGSAAPKRSVVVDFAWDKVPGFLQGQFLLVVSLLDRDAPRGEPKLYVTAAPEGMEAESFPSGPRVGYADIQEIFIPEPEPEVAVKRVVEVRDQPAAAPWLLWFGTLPGVVTLVGGLLLLLLLIMYLFGRGTRRARGRPKAGGAGADHPSREVTLVLWDRLHREIVREETRTLDDSLRIGPTSDSDFVVPGPYSLDVLHGNGEGPAVRSANMLGLEMHRSGGRTLMLGEGEAVAIRNGDRVDIGGGHEVELKIH